MSSWVARPILIRPPTTLRGPPQAVREPGVVHVDHRRRQARPGVGRRDPGPHQARADHADAADRDRPDRVVVDTRVALEAVLHEEQGDQVRRDRRAHHLQGRLALDLQPLVEREVAPLADRLEGNQRRRVIPLRLHPDRPLGRGEGEGHRVRAEAEPLACLPTPGLPLVLIAQALDPPDAGLDQPFGRDGVEGEAEVDGPRGGHRVAGADQLDGIQADQPRQPLGPSPAGDDPELDLGQGDFRLGTGRDDPVIQGQGQLGPAAHAVAVDQGDRRERQAADAVEELMAERDGPADLVLVRVGQRPQLAEVRPGDELSGLPAPDEQAFQVGAVRELRDDRRELAQDRLRQRVDLLPRQVEREEADAVAPLLELECFAHRGLRDSGKSRIDDG